MVEAGQPLHRAAERQGHGAADRGPAAHQPLARGPRGVQRGRRPPGGGDPRQAQGHEGRHRPLYQTVPEQLLVSSPITL